jgi:hypothetical protein
VLPRRWVAERTFEWISRCRRTVRDYERLPAHHAATVWWAIVILMTRRLARYHARGRLPAPRGRLTQFFKRSEGLVKGAVRASRRTIRPAGFAGRPREGTDRHGHDRSATLAQ